MNEEFSKSLKKGDLKAYNKLFNTYYPRLFSYALKLSNDRSIAKDIVQEAFIKLWLNKHHIKTDLPIGNYLLKICHNEFLIHARKRKKEKALLDQIKLEIAYEMFAYEDQDLSRIDQVKKVIDALSPKCKEAFILSKYEKMKYKAIGDKMGISIKTVENHISKAYSELKKNIKYLKVLF